MYTYITKYTHKKNRVDINHLKHLRPNSCNVCRPMYILSSQSESAFNIKVVFTRHMWPNTCVYICTKTEYIYLHIPSRSNQKYG